MIIHTLKQIMYAWLPPFDSKISAKQNPPSEAPLAYTQAQYYEKLAIEHNQAFASLHASHSTAEKKPTTQDHRNAIWNFLNAALKGHRDAQYKLGLCYLKGDLGLDKNYTRAKEWLEKAAKQGHPEAQHLLLTAYNKITYS